MGLDYGVMPNRIWIETQESEPDACDVIVEMDNNTFFTASFVTIPYLHRQMELSCEVCKQVPDATAIRYAVMETPHIVVESLSRDIIEDTIDNLLALDTFETAFTPVVDQQDVTVADRERTLEVAVAVLTDVLKAEDATVA